MSVEDEVAILWKSNTAWGIIMALQEHHLLMRKRKLLMKGLEDSPLNYPDWKSCCNLTHCDLMNLSLKVTHSRK